MSSRVTSAAIPTVVIVGRTNVGKSALFNRLTETTKAIISRVAGTTRDYNIGEVAWNGRQFSLIDTGGVSVELLDEALRAIATRNPKKARRIIAGATVDNPEAVIHKGIVQQIRRAVTNADLLIVVVDGQTGSMPTDQQLALALKRLGKPTILVCNKVDNQRLQTAVNDFYRLGLGTPYAVSAANGVGTGDLLDIILGRLKRRPGRPVTPNQTRPIRLTLMGKPNVGKSSLVNAILGVERVIVSPVAQTTREPQDTALVYQNQPLVIVDTAGLRRKARVKPGLERAVNKKTIAALKNSDLVLLVTQAHEPLTIQDLRLIKLIQEYQLGVVIVVNKWDLVPDKTEKSADELKHYYAHSLPGLSWAPLLFVSAKTGFNVSKILDLALEIWQQRQTTIDQSELDQLLRQLTSHKRPVQARGPFKPHIATIKQARTNPPRFTVVLDRGEGLHFSYIRYIENQIRRHTAFLGVPITLTIQGTRVK